MRIWSTYNCRSSRPFSSYSLLVINIDYLQCYGSCVQPTHEGARLISLRNYSMFILVCRQGKDCMRGCSVVAARGMVKQGVWTTRWAIRHGSQNISLFGPILFSWVMISLWPCGTKAGSYPSLPGPLRRPAQTLIGAEGRDYPFSPWTQTAHSSYNIWRWLDIASHDAQSAPLHLHGTKYMKFTIPQIGRVYVSSPISLIWSSHALLLPAW